MAEVQRISPCLWFDREAEEAAKFYVRIFERSRITRITHYGNEGQGIHGQPAGSVLTVNFELDGCPLTALNGGPSFKFTEAISLQVGCETPEEIDRYWEALSAGGDPKAQQCGWLKDRYGLSWQVAPVILPELLDDADQKKADRTMRAMLGMKKLDIDALKTAHGGKREQVRPAAARV
jgi:predicted 3-demethylubiquinone-9 3-methyltransferase (glyoxalase superfamily)